MRHLITVASTVIVASACEPTIDENAPTYWQEFSCSQVLFPEIDELAGWRFCVEKVVATRGMLEYHVCWSGFGHAHIGLNKLSDDGNKNMYLVDDLGNRYDHVETRGAARNDTRLDSQTRVTGVFVFPAPSPDATSFTFKDDEHGVEVGPIRLDPDSRSTRGASRELLARVLEGSSLTIVDSRFSLDSGYTVSYDVERTAGGFRLKRDNSEIPDEAVARLLETLSTAPVVHRDYLPMFASTDNYQFVSIRVKSSTGTVTFGSSSQGPGMVPWVVGLDDRLWVIPDDTPARALKHVERYLPKFEISVRDHGRR